MQLVIKRTRARQPWHWSLWYDNGKSASNGGERFPDEQCVARAVYRYQAEHESRATLNFRGVPIEPEWWNNSPEPVFVKHLLQLIRERPPEGTGIGGKRGTRKGAK